MSTNLSGCILIEPVVYKDERGYFLETFKKNSYLKNLDIKYDFVQDNQSYSQKNILRGLHFQKNNPQGKLVRVSRGTVFDVVVDIRKNSETFGKWESFILSDDNFLQLWVPPGFAHGFLSLTGNTILQYKCTDYYDPNDEHTIIWNDDDLNIDWPISNPKVSQKDKDGKKFKHIF